MGWGPSLIVQSILERLSNTGMSKLKYKKWIKQMLNIEFRKKNSLNVIYICPFFGIFCSFPDIFFRFLADPPGTHWYHSHLGTERTDGLSGALIVLPKPDKTTVTPLLSYSDKKQTFQLDTFITVNAYELSIIQIFKNPLRVCGSIYRKCQGILWWYFLTGNLILPLKPRTRLTVA